MKRKSRYDDKVIAFAVAERKRGTRWKEIVEAIGRHFGMKPPTERQMRKWYQEFGVDAEDPEKLLKENLIKVARATNPIAAFAAQKLAIEQVPTLVEAWKQGKDLWVAGGLMILSMLEQSVGTDKFDQILTEFKENRKDNVTPALAEEDESVKPPKKPKRRRSA